ncbi:hypothetical protein M3Y96_01150800 [Aphelenchoides besseyi]|nr:hypothetical protein M3Y96_01150800 [Aphelenchoides besseyi]
MSSTDDIPPSLWHRFSCLSANIKTGLICAALFNLAFGISDIVLLICSKADYSSYVLPEFNIFFSIFLVLVAFKRNVLAVYAYIILNGILIALELILVILVGLASVFSNENKLLDFVDLINWIYPEIGYIGGKSTIDTAVYFILIQLVITSARILFQTIACHAFIQIKDQRREEETPLMTDAERRDQDLLLLTSTILNFSN